MRSRPALASRSAFAPLLVLLLGLAVACAPAPAPPSAPAPAPPAAPAAAPPAAPAAPPAAPAVPPPAVPPKEKATLRFDFTPLATHMGSALAFVRGYYEQEGIDLEIGEGTGSGITVQLVGSGQATFGLADAGTMAVLVAKGVPVKMIGTVIQRGPIGVIYLPPLKIEQAADLVGKSVGTSPGDASYTALPAVMKKAGLSTDVYTVINMDPSARIPSFLERRFDTVVGFNFGDYLRAWTRNPEAQITLYTAMGVNVLSTGYVAHLDTLQRNPDLVRRFIRATQRGWADARADPAAAVAAVKEVEPIADDAVVAAGIPMVIDHEHTPYSQGRPLFWTAEEDWRDSIAVLKEYGGLEGDKPLSDYYTNEFISTQ